MNSKTNPRGVARLVLRAVALGMGVAVIVLNIVATFPIQSSVFLLGIGLTALALDALH